ncbi:MAG TPA: heavy metal-binding domain-containing protein [Ktedonobacteraceae bacterium]|nr:heavy metal-binding domain-containing protein [Ktedonobacteraceae bacterium]
MPFWKRSSPEEQQQRLQAQQEAEASLRSLEEGGLPLQAQRRLREETEADHKLFSSDLSIKEFALTRNSGYQPLSQVMGSSIYHVGWQYTTRFPRMTVAYELTNLTNAHLHAAQLALGRLEQEASLLKAHGVIGVRFGLRNFEWGSNLVEYTAIGTAIRLPNAPLFPRPFLSDLSGQEFWTLLQAGYLPTGIAMGYCSYCISSGWQLNQVMRSWNNIEVTDYTQAIYTARHLAMSRLQAMARGFDAVGVVGMHIGFDRQENEYERENDPTTYRDLMIHFSAIGTAIIARRPDHVIPSPKLTLTFTDLRPGRRGEVQELTFRE